MLSRGRRGLLAAALALTLGSCIERERPAEVAHALRSASRWPLPDRPVKIGPAYTIGGVTYTPRDERGYDQVGLASWYGHEAGERTANGETFRPRGITAAHKTLPLPSYVEVTVLETGRTLLVRVNDRGPFVAGRLIDLSRGAAEALDLLHGRPAQVRVRRVEPPTSDRLALRTGGLASPRPSALPVLVATAAPRPPLHLELPTAEPDPPAAAAEGWFVQVASLSDGTRAEALRAALRPIRPAGIERRGGVWRVRVGPLDERRARSALAQVQGRGYQDAVLTRPHRSPEDMPQR